jgi:mutator protein MutT
LSPAAPSSTKLIHVVAAAVTGADGRVLIAQRPQGKVLAGSWEFPGGKVEPGEGRVQALRRELKEELGLELTGHPRPLMRLRHVYPFGDVLIDMWVVTRHSGAPVGLDGQALCWCTLDELASVDLLPADRPIVRTLRLPEHLAREASTDYIIGTESITRSGTPGKLRGAVCGTVAEGIAAASSGAEFLAVRFEWSADDVARLCESVLVPVYARGIPLDLAFSLGASGTNAVAPDEVVK